MIPTPHPFPEKDDPDEIWLQPWCAQCEATAGEQGRLWCKDNVWSECGDCGRLPAKYIRHDPERNDPDDDYADRAEWKSRR